MRKFNVNVNGNSYVVEVEEVGAENTAPVVSPVNAVAPAAPAPVAKPAAPAPAPKPAVTGGTTLKCPMPGKVLKLLCKDGDKVAKNQRVLLLEAMKMENDIVAPADGIITYIAKEGEDVVSQQDLAVIK